MGCTAPFCALFLPGCSLRDPPGCTSRHTTATSVPTLGCLKPKPMDHSLLSQAAVSVLNPKSGLRVTLVCIGAIQQDSILGLASPCLAQGSTGTKALTPEQGLVHTPWAGLCVKPCWSSANSLETHFCLTWGVPTVLRDGASSASQGLGQTCGKQANHLYPLSGIYQPRGGLDVLAAPFPHAVRPGL